MVAQPLNEPSSGEQWLGQGSYTHFTIFVFSWTSVVDGPTFSLGKLFHKKVAPLMADCSIYSQKQVTIG